MSKQEVSSGSRAAADVSALLRARNPLLWIVTREEGRVERLLMEAAQSAQYEPLFWDCASGITNYAGASVNAGCTDPAEVLRTIRQQEQRRLWILRDMPAWFRDPTVTRALRSLARSLPLSPRDQARAVIVLTPSSEVPPELAGHAIVIEWPLPDRAEIGAILDSAVSALPEEVRANAAPNGAREAAIDAAVGLTAEEAQSCYAKSLVSTRRIDPVAVAGEKKRVIARERVLEWLDPLPGGLDEVGGLDQLKEFAKTVAAALTKEAREYGLPRRKGVLCVGQPGCGKTLFAKAIATALNVPLLKLDLGALRSKYVGESEGNLRRALNTVKSIGLCVLMLDEVEKGLAGATQGAADGGVSADALGTVLQFQQDNRDAFLVATCNDASALPAAFLRKGRFDEVFFVDLPTNEERAEILRAAMRQYNREPLSIEDAYTVARACEGFTGSEIAAIVPDAMFKAFGDGARPIIAADLVAAARVVVPLSKTAAESVAKLREWAKGRARPASTQPTSTARTERALEI